jgi:hypothetical protein
LITGVIFQMWPFSYFKRRRERQKAAREQLCREIDNLQGWPKLATTEDRYRNAYADRTIEPGESLVEYAARMKDQDREQALQAATRRSQRYQALASEFARKDDDLSNYIATQAAVNAIWTPTPSYSSPSCSSSSYSSSSSDSSSSSSGGGSSSSCGGGGGSD